MRTNRSTKEWTHEPDARYRNPINITPRCGCGRMAKYRVYSHREPHCHFCLEEAVEGADMVPVSAI